MTILHDSFVIDGVRRTNDGYLTAFARVARVGVQTYRGSELGRPDLETVRLYRPPEEVFSADAMQSFAHRPVTLKHPPKPVTAKNWKQYAKGQTGGEVVRDGEFVRVPLVMMDEAIIDAYERGTKELSMGYSTDIQWKTGVTDSGEEYDAVQTAIRGNHLAVVPVARGGKDLRIGDEDTNDNGELPMKTMVIDGLSVQIADENHAAIIERHIKKLTTDLATVTDSFEDFKKKAKEQDEDKSKKVKDAETLVQTKDGEIAVLKKQVADSAITPEKLDVLVKDRAEIIGKAKTLLDSAYVFDGKTIDTIRKDAVAAHFGGHDAIKDMEDGAIVGAFRAITKGVKADDSSTEIVDAMSRRPHNSGTIVNDAREKAIAERDAYLQNAWKTPASAA